MEIELGIVSKYGPMVFGYLGFGILIHTVVILFGAVLYSGSSISNAPVVWPSPISWFVFATAWPAMLFMAGAACVVLGVAHLVVHALAEDPPRPVIPPEDNAPTQPLTTPAPFMPEARRSSPSIDPEDKEPFH